MGRRLYFWSLVVAGIATVIGIIVTRGQTEIGVTVGGLSLVGVLLLLWLRSQGDR